MSQRDNEKITQTPRPEDDENHDIGTGDRVATRLERLAFKLHDLANRLLRLLPD